MIILIGIAIVVVAIAASISYLMSLQAQQNNYQYMTKGNVSAPASIALPENYTSSQLLDYCSQNESLIYDDVCIRGLWNVNDECKNGNFSSTNSVCADPRLGQFEDMVDKEMQDLNTSLEKFVTSCMNVTSDKDIGNCYFNMERIKTDCTDPRYASMMTICNDSRFDQFDEKYKDILSKLGSSE